ncbi:MAG: peptidyl-prolyl cis-trans isomerase [Labilithrix sp.]|nr:peptidyl-prolyl cis-trans isomerase [Labilithrix sp.]
MVERSSYRMLQNRRGIFAGVLVASLAATAASHAAPAEAGAADADEAARRAKIAVTVGSRTVTVAELEDRLAEIPPFQAAIFGASREEIVRAYVDQVLVRDLLLGAGAEQKKLDQRLPTSHQLLRARSTATLRALRSGELRSPATIPAEDVKKYYEDNRSRFDSPERVNLWRILCKTRDEADTVLATAKRDLTIAKYNDLARDHSIDKATNFRGGNLGFVAPDGVSNEAGVKVDPTLVKAAAAVGDGELVPEPVPEGSAFAIVWRRTTVPATRRSLEEATAQIRATLYRERTEASERKLIDELRAKHLRDVNIDPLKIIEFPAFDAGISLPRSIPRAPEAGPRPAP